MWLSAAGCLVSGLSAYVPVRRGFMCKTSGKHKQTALDLVQKLLSLMISKQVRNRQQLRLLVIIGVTKYFTLTAGFLNATLLK